MVELQIQSVKRNRKESQVCVTTKHITLWIDYIFKIIIASVHQK